MTNVCPRFSGWIRRASVVLLAFTVGCGGNGGPTDSGDGESTTVPGSWAGVWEVTQTETSCSEKDPADTTYTTTDTLCSGATIEEAFMDPTGSSALGALTWDCSGSFTNTEGNWECTAIETADDCTITHTTTFTGTRNGAMITGGGEKRTAHSGDCGSDLNSCARYTVEAERTGGPPDECSGEHFPDLPDPWGGRWEIHEVTLSCTTQEIVGDTLYTELMCAGQPFDPRFCAAWDDYPGVIQCGCEVEVTDSTLAYVCEGAANYLGCVFSGRMEYAVERDGDEFAGTGRFTVWTSANCPVSQSDCFDLVFTGHRTSDDQSGCGSPTSDAVRPLMLTKRLRLPEF